MKQKGQWRGSILYFMRDRYGKNDLLNKHMLLLSFVGIIVSPFIPWKFIIIFPLLLLLMAYKRIFSKNIAKREKENRAYLDFLKPVLFQRTKFKHRHVYYYRTCSSCKQKLRIPKLDDKTIRVTCPNCHHQAIIKR
ncbi:MAG: hypothetical protein ACTJHC_06810 [Vagococcus sp.]